MNEDQMKQVYTEHAAEKEQVRAAVLERIAADTAPRRRAARWKPVLAACLSLLLLLGSLGGHAIAAEAKEYRTAVAFFDEYRLSTEGLTRAEIKAVYKDITMKIYSYEKTIELLNTLSVEMYETELGAADKASFAALWEEHCRLLFHTGEESQVGLWYKIDYEDGLIGDIFAVCMNGETELWRYQLPSDVNLQLLPCARGVCVYGNKGWTGSRFDGFFVLLLDSAGTSVWLYEDEVAIDCRTACLSGDGIAFIGSYTEDKQPYRLFTLLDRNGKPTVRKEYPDDTNANYNTLVKVGDTYLVKRGVRQNYEWVSELVSVSAEGALIDKFTYADGGTTYQIQDIFAYKGKVYLSALRPNIPQEEFTKRCFALFGEYYQACEREKDVGVTMPEEYRERLRRLFIDSYAAVLLVCDGDAVITKAYTAENARAGTLSLSEEGALAWQVLRIDDVKNVPLVISSRSLDILSTEFTFVFDGDGKLTAKTEIGVYPMWY